jgi:hypothetical protein
LCLAESRVTAAALVSTGEVLGFSFLGAAITFLTPYLSALSPWNPGTWTPEVYWHRILGPPIGWWTGCFCYSMVKVSIRLSRTAALVQSIELLDLNPLSPFVHQAVRNVLLVVGALSIAGLFVIESWMWTTLALIAAVVLPIGVIGLLLPVYGIHRRIRKAKQEELRWTLEGIRKARLRLKASSSDAASSQMADLITYHQFIDEVPEWPFRISTFVRVFLYLLIPLVSWAGGVLLEMILGRVVG